MAATNRDPYEVLGVSRSATLDELKSAYRRKAMEYHPDRNPGNKEAEERFKELSEAYALLRDPDARARYDRYGAAGQPGYRPDPTSVNWHEVFREADINIDWDARGGMPSGGGTIFDALFSVMSGMLRGAGVFPGQSYEVPLPVTLSELKRGATRRLRVPAVSVCQTCGGSGRVIDAPPRSPGPFEATTPPPPPGTAVACPECRGRGVKRGAQLDVRVPAGAAPGAKLRLRGAGGPGSPPGDVLARLELTLPEGASLSGRDVHAKLSITPLEARRGTTTSFEGVTVRVPPGSESGSVIRVAGGGVRSSGATGDLVLELDADWLRGAGRLATGWFRKLVEGGRTR